MIGTRLNKTPLVSIIMPTYNRSCYIMESIESIINQTYHNWELIIMDDGSDDETPTLVDQLTDQRIRYFSKSHTGRVSQLKNEGIRLAEGELLAFNDSDDLWAKSKLEKQVSALLDHPEAGFSLAGGYTFYSQNNPVTYFYKQREGIKVDNILIPFFRSQVSGFTQALLLWKECVNTTGYFDETKLFSDPDYIISLASHYQAVMLYEPLVYRRLHEGGDSVAHWDERYDEWIAVIKATQSKGLLPTSEASDALFRVYINFGEKSLMYNQKRKAVRKFLKAFQYRPFSIVPIKKAGKAILARKRL